MRPCETFSTNRVKEKDTEFSKIVMENKHILSGRMSRRGFTLIELLIVIGILAILATSVTLVLNPAELLKQARDSQRITDLRILRGAIDIYLTRASSPNLNFLTTGLCDSFSAPGGGTWRASNNVSVNNNIPANRQPFNTPDTAIASAVIVPDDARRIDGNGWVPVPFDSLSASGLNAPISKLPLDPAPNIGALLTTTGTFYAYQCQGFTYEIDANMESFKYGDPTSSNDVENKDGGTSACSGAGPATGRCDAALPTKADLIYEIGNAPGLAL